MSNDEATALYANDAVDLDDRFNTVRVGDNVAKMTLEVPTPFTMGVVGKWGAGKTSILRRAFATLGGQGVEIEVPFAKSPKEESGWNRWSRDFDSRMKELDWDPGLSTRADCSLCVWYSPWKHQHSDNPLLPLLFEIRQQFSALAKSRDIVRASALAGMTLLERVIDGALLLTGVSKRPLVTGTTDAVRNAWKESNATTQMEDGQRFQLLFEDAVEIVLKGLEDAPSDNPTLQEHLTDQRGLTRLIVFVDDLDRCEESVVVELLEAIKLYLGAPRCVFVLGIDESAVLSALGRHWPGRLEDDNREYLEKLFQAVIPVPVPEPAKVQAWVIQQLKLHGFEHPELCATIIGDVIEPNPRKIKNFVNTACAGWGLLNKKAGQPDPDARKLFEQRFVIAQYLRLNHKPLWRLLERDPRTLRVVTSVLGGGTLERLKEDPDFDPADQKLLKKFVERSFIHVLGRDVNVEEPGLMPDKEELGHLKLSEAVDLFAQRLDRKRGDQKLRHHYNGVFKAGECLPEEFLYLPGGES